MAEKMPGPLPEWVVRCSTGTPARLGKPYHAQGVHLQVSWPRCPGCSGPADFSYRHSHSSGAGPPQASHPAPGAVLQLGLGCSPAVPGTGGARAPPGTARPGRLLRAPRGETPSAWRGCGTARGGGLSAGAPLHPGRLLPRAPGRSAVGTGGECRRSRGTGGAAGPGPRRSPAEAVGNPAARAPVAARPLPCPPFVRAAAPLGPYLPPPGPLRSPPLRSARPPPPAPPARPRSARPARRPGRHRPRRPPPAPPRGPRGAPRLGRSRGWAGAALTAAPGAARGSGLHPPHCPAQRSPPLLAPSGLRGDREPGDNPPAGGLRSPRPRCL